MYVVEVMPIQRGVFKDSLTFFAREAVPLGSVVSAPVRKQMVPALVMTCTDVRESKLDLKASGFALKKLGAATPRQLFGADFIHSTHAVARYYAASVGSVVAQLTFASLLVTPRRLSVPPLRNLGAVRTKPEVLVLQAESGDRVQAYRNLVRECFARGRSVMIIAPTLVEVELLKNGLARGIEERTVVASSAQTPKELRVAWDLVADHRQPILIIGTPPVLSFPRTDLDAIVIERESARSYIARTRPSLDLRKAAEYVAAANGARLFLADFPVRVETFARLHDGTADDMGRPQARSGSSAVINVMDVRQSDKTKEERRYFTALHEATYEKIESVVNSGGRVVIYAARRGIAPLTVCNDCGTPITDPATDAPMVLHKTPTGNVFMSHRSGAVLSADRSCSLCGGWNLVTLGIGVERVQDELLKRLPNVTVIPFTQDTAPTHKSALKLADSFYKKAGSILIGTERMIPYVHDSVELVVVASIDSTLSLPAWRAHEHAHSVLYALLNRASQTYIVETRKSDSTVMKSVASGSPMEFLRNEVKERRTYEYPPFATFVGLSWTGTEAVCKTIHEQVVLLCKDYDVVGPLPPEAIERNKFVERAVIRVRPADWPNELLSLLLKSLPTSVAVTIDPDEIV